VLRGHDSSVTSVAFHPADGTLATGGADNTVRLWTPKTERLASWTRMRTVERWKSATENQMTLLYRLNGRVTSVAFSPDGRLLATGGVDNAARLWKTKDEPHVVLLSLGEFLTLANRSVKLSVYTGEHIAFGVLSPDGRIIAAPSILSVTLYEVATGKEIAELRGHERRIEVVAFSPDGRLLATGGQDETVRLWEVATGKEIAELRGHEEFAGLISGPSVAFSPDGQAIATCGLDETARLWEAATGKEITVLRLPAPKGRNWENLFHSCRSVAFSPDGRLLVTGGLDETVRLREVATGKEIAVLRRREELPGTSSYVTSVAFSPDGSTVAVGLADNTTQLWEVASGKELAKAPNVPDSLESVAFTPDGRTLVTGSWSWRVGRQRLIDLGCARVDRLPLSKLYEKRVGTPDEWCTPEVSAALRARLGLDTSFSARGR
jgi:WD40 repeat protein